MCAVPKRIPRNAVTIGHVVSCRKEWNRHVRVQQKFSKSWIGFEEVNIFGYQCSHKSFKLTDDRKTAIMTMPFPTDGNRCKKMPVALSCGVFLSPFVPNYSFVIWPRHP